MIMIQGQEHSIMGILNQKNSIMDTILTDEGRRQLGAGKFQPAFYSFSDAGAVYSPLDTLVSGTSPQTNIATTLTFEAFPLPQDQVAYEADDSGGLVVSRKNNYFPLPSVDNVRVLSGKLIQGWENGNAQILTSSAQFSSFAASIISGSADNFRKLMILKSPDLLYSNRDEFKLSTENMIEFRIDDNTLLPGNITNGILESSENLFSDRRLSHVDNFTYLPPINKRATSNLPSKEIGNYGNVINGNRQILTYDDLRNEFKHTVVQTGSVQQVSHLQKQTINFSETSITNRLVGQMFEVAQGKITKLDVIDFGIFTVKKTDPSLFPDAVPTPLNQDLVTSTTRIQIYFVGKVFMDSTGNNKFINIFTLVYQ